VKLSERRPILQRLLEHQCLSTNKGPWRHLLRGGHVLPLVALIQVKACAMDNPRVSTGSLGLRGA